MTEAVETNDDYWDCECVENYIHLKSDTLYCSFCNAKEEDQPDSRVNEIAQLK